MSVPTVSPESVALASNQHPSKISGNNQSVAEKATEREAVAKPREDPGTTRGRGIKLDVDI